MLENVFTPKFLMFLSMLSCAMCFMLTCLQVFLHYFDTELKLNRVVLHFLYFYVTQVYVYLFESSK